MDKGGMRFKASDPLILELKGKWSHADWRLEESWPACYLNKLFLPVVPLLPVLALMFLMCCALLICMCVLHNAHT